MPAEDYETTKPVEVELDGVKYKGMFRVISGSVIVYYKDEIKFAPHGMNLPDVVARWLLSDVCRKLQGKERKAIGGQT
ncbi:MAG TPA: hypothetical protein VF534_25555 [Paraburkholderia sp.]